MRNSYNDFEKIEKVIDSCTNVKMLLDVFNWAAKYVQRNYKHRYYVVYMERVSKAIQHKKQLLQWETWETVNYYLVYQATIPVGGSIEVIQGNRVVMIASDALYVQNSVATSGDVWISALTAQ